MTFELPNETCENIHLKGKYMYFSLMKCIGETHNLQKDDCGKVEIHNFARSVRLVTLPAEIYTESGIGVCLPRVFLSCDVQQIYFIFLRVSVQS